MNEDVTSEDYGTIQSVNMQQDASILQYRLDTSPTMEELEITLTGKKRKIVVEKGKNEDDDEYKEIITKIAEPKCNDEGTRSIMTYVRIFANPQTLTANVREDTLGEYIANRRREVLRDIARNQYSYGIKNSDISNIIDNIINCIYIELTHAVGAGTRNSLSQSSKITEVVNGAERKKPLLGFLKR